MKTSMPRPLRRLWRDQLSLQWAKSPQRDLHYRIQSTNTFIVHKYSCRRRGELHRQTMAFGPLDLAIKLAALWQVENVILCQDSDRDRMNMSSLNTPGTSLTWHHEMQMESTTLTSCPPTFFFF